MVGSSAKVEAVRVNEKTAFEAARKSYMGGWPVRRPVAIPVGTDLVYLPFWVGQARLRLRGARGDRTASVGIACDGWKGDSGKIEGVIPDFGTSDLALLPHVVPCRIGEGEARRRMEETAPRFATGKYLLATISDLALELVYVPHWAVYSEPREGGLVWRLVSANTGHVTFRFDPELRDMLSAAGIQVSR